MYSFFVYYFIVSWLAWRWEKYLIIRRVLRYHRGNQNPQFEKEQTTQWPKEKKDKQRSTKHTHETKDRVSRSSRNTRGELSLP